MSSASSDTPTVDVAIGNTPAHPLLQWGIQRARSDGTKSTSYRSIEHVLMSSKCIENRHLRRLTNGGEAFYASPSVDDDDGKEEEDTDERNDKNDSLSHYEPWAKRFVELLVLDERFANLATQRSKLLKKELVESVSMIERVEEAMLKYENADIKDTGKGLLLLDLCSGKGAAGIMLALRFPQAKVVCVDIRPPSTSERHMHERIFDNLDRVTGNVYDDALMANLLSQTPENGTCILIGTHLCGDLSRVAVDIVGNHANVISAAIIAPCCLQRQRSVKRMASYGADGWGFDTTLLARKQGTDPFELWLERLLDRADVADIQKTLFRDESMLSDKNAYLLIHRGEKEMFCQEVNACAQQLENIDIKA